MVEVDKILKNTLKKGEIKIGTKETKQTVKNKKAKIVVIADNCPYAPEINELAKKNKIPIYNYESNSINLGYICGKAYAVSVFAVIDDGGSNILSLVKKK